MELERPQTSGLGRRLEAEGGASAFSLNTCPALSEGTCLIPDISRFGSLTLL